MVNLITNGSFEIGQDPGSNFITLRFNSTAINNWVVTDDSIDYKGTFWQASDGNRSLDLDGEEPGAIAQSFNTIIGQNYVVTFDLAGNPVNDPTIKTMRVEAGGQSADFTFDTTGKNFNNMGWTPQSWQFTATASQTTLQFRSLTNGTAYGPALDNVRVEAVSSANISINDVAITEGNSGITQARFTVSLSNPSTFPISVDYSTQDGSGITGARAGQDYLSIGGTLQFRPGQTSQTIIVPIVGDTTPELDETFFVNLRNPVGAALTRSEAIGTIINDDATPLSLSINDVTVTEGNSGNSSGQLLVTRSGNLTTSTQLRYTVLGGSASNRTDYTLSNGTINFLPRETVKPITFSIKGDAISEAQENFRVRISANNAVITKDIGNVTINDNDISQISINDISIREGNRGTTNAGMTISLSNPSQERITLDYRLIPQTARVNEDFRGTRGTITINPGQTRAPLNVPIIADTKKEANETLKVQLTRVTSNVNSRIQRSQGTIAIIDDDSTPRVGFSTNNIRVTEGNRGVNNLSIPVSLSNTSQETVLINYRTVNGTARSNQDYRPASGTLRFNNGETRKNITVGILGDLAVEPDETLRLELFSPSNATLGTSRVNLTLVNDDRPSRSLGNVKTNLTTLETPIIPTVSEFEGKDFFNVG